jgi:hypothetical protein
LIYSCHDPFFFGAACRHPSRGVVRRPSPPAYRATPCFPPCPRGIHVVPIRVPPLAQVCPIRASRAGPAPSVPLLLRGPSGICSVSAVRAPACRSLSLCVPSALLWWCALCSGCAMLCTVIQLRRCRAIYRGDMFRTVVLFCSH